MLKEGMSAQDVMGAFKFTEKDRIKLVRALRSLTKASASASNAMKHFGITAKVMEEQAGLKG